MFADHDPVRIIRIGEWRYHAIGGPLKNLKLLHYYSGVLSAIVIVSGDGEGETMIRGGGCRESWTLALYRSAPSCPYDTKVYTRCF